MNSSLPNFNAALVDFDWSLKVFSEILCHLFVNFQIWCYQIVLSSDKVSGLNTPIILLKFNMLNEDGSHSNKIIELTSSDVRSLVNTLKDAQQVRVNFFKSILEWYIQRLVLPLKIILDLTFWQPKIVIKSSSRDNLLFSL